MSARPIFTGIVDMHHADGSYDLDEVKAGGVAALWHKATEGVTYKDRGFWTAMDRAGKAGLLRGAYHFASGTSDAVAQADEFIAVVNALVQPTDDVLLALDLEGGLDEPETMTTANAARFVERVRAVTGRWPVLYAGASKTRERFRRDPEALMRLRHCPLWLAQYGEMPTPGGIPDVWPDWTLWQYTNGKEGPHDRIAFPRKTPGFTREAQDRSAWRGTADELRAWWLSCGRDLAVP